MLVFDWPKGLEVTALAKFINLFNEYEVLEKIIHLDSQFMQFDPDSLIRFAEFSYQVKNKFAWTIYFMDTHRAEMATSKALAWRKAHSPIPDTTRAQTLAKPESFLAGLIGL